MNRSELQRNYWLDKKVESVDASGKFTHEYAEWLQDALIKALQPAGKNIEAGNSQNYPGKIYLDSNMASVASQLSSRLTKNQLTELFIKTERNILTCKS